MVPTPGSRKLERLDENTGAAAVDLTPDDLRDIQGAASRMTIERAFAPPRPPCSPSLIYESRGDRPAHVSAFSALARRGPIARRQEGSRRARLYSLRKLAFV